MKAIQVSRTGGPEVLELVDLPKPEPGPGEILVRQEAIGLNYIDTYQRSGLYKMDLPFVLGGEGAGVVEKVGEGVTRFAVGDRAAYAGGSGAYAEHRALAADRAVKLPDAISTETAAAAMLKGMTAEYLVRRTYPLRVGETALIYAAAGGVGSILVQWASAIGATVVGVAGGPDKVAIARELGADHVVDHHREDIAGRVAEVTGGEGVHVVYDGVGKATFEASLKSLRRRGMLVSYGNASGAVEPFDPLALSRGGSLYLTRPTLYDYVATPEELDASAAALFDMITSGKVRIAINQRFPLAEAASAHRALEASETTGSTLLIP
jgi:NADPH2:quinone reductase